MILGFKKQFTLPILRGTKIHTIREDKHNRWKAGAKIHFATGVRTKNYAQFTFDTCVSVQKIEIEHVTGLARVFIDKRLFGEIWHHGFDDIYEYTNDLLTLAMNDGFNDLTEFFEWFDKPFIGKIIHWTEKRY